VNFLANLSWVVGRWTVTTLEQFGSVALYAFDLIRCLFKYPWRWRLILEEIYLLGVRSQFVILTTGAFTGAVFAAQVHFQFAKLQMESATGPTVSVAMCRELGPVLCCLMLAGRVGAAMAAEIASMKNTEQVDALRSMGVYPTEYLGVPRLIGMIVSAPLLTAQAIGIGIFFGYLVAVQMMGVDGAYYWDNTVRFTGERDIIVGLVKGLTFGLIIAIISCHKGFNPGRGTAGVGRTTTEAVVNSSIIILIFDFFITIILNNLLLKN
jgi:phospholipid/cholesterol/gamma-HCH transport system permease protein